MRPVVAIFSETDTQQGPPDCQTLSRQERSRKFKQVKAPEAHNVETIKHAQRCPAHQESPACSELHDSFRANAQENRFPNTLHYMDFLAESSPVVNLPLLCCTPSCSSDQSGLDMGCCFLIMRESCVVFIGPAASPK